MEQPPAPDPAMGRLIWRCRRGMKELDLLLAGYLREHWTQAGPAERATFERILELPDPLLAAYLMEREAPPDQDLRSLLAVLRGRAAGRLPAADATVPASVPPQS
jgi:antitoxin CptB